MKLLVRLQWNENFHAIRHTDMLSGVNLTDVHIRAKWDVVGRRRLVEILAAKAILTFELLETHAGLVRVHEEILAPNKTCKLDACLLFWCKGPLVLELVRHVEVFDFWVELLVNGTYHLPCN